MTSSSVTTFKVTLQNKTVKNEWFQLGDSMTYHINGEEAPTLSLEVGVTYTFLIDALGHPFYLTSSSIGVSDDFIAFPPLATGIATFTPTEKDACNFFYQCVLHPLMGGKVVLKKTEPCLPPTGIPPPDTEEDPVVVPGGELISTCSPLLTDAMNRRRYLKTFDVVIVGTGPTGCALLRRLITNPALKIAVIEDGAACAYQDSTIRLPGALSGFPGKYFHVMAEGKEALVSNDIARTAYAGKGFGGGNLINGMQYVQSSSAKWDEFAQRQENQDPGRTSLWSGPSIYERMYALEKVHGDIPEDLIGSERGRSGVLPIRLPSGKANPFAVTIGQAFMKVLGLPLIDHNDITQPVGVSFKNQLFQTETKERSTLPLVFFQNNQLPPNVTFFEKTRMNRLWWDTSTIHEYPLSDVLLEEPPVEERVRGRGVWVTSKQDDVAFAIEAKKVFLCAGAAITPCLLQASGIGPRSLLQEAEIPLVVPLASVGQSFRNHFGTFINLRVPQILPEEKSLNDKEDIYSAYIHLPNPDDPKQRFAQVGIFSIGSLNGYHNFLAFVSVYQSSSPHGVVRLESNGYHPTSNINVQWNIQEKDIQESVQATRLTLSTFREGLPSSWEVDPSFAQKDGSPLSDEALREKILRSLNSYGHLHGGCAMKPIAKGGVVNSEGRVYGTQNVFVCDASVFNTTMDSNTTMPCLSVGDTLGLLHSLPPLV